MIKGIFRLTNDVQARAGDYLVIREDDFVSAVSHAALANLFAYGVTPAAYFEAAAAEAPTRKKREWRSAETLERMRANGRRLAEVRRRQRAAVAAE